MTYEEYLEKNQTMTYRNVGVSMLPLLRQGRDLFTVEKKTKERCKVGDVVLYRRPPQSYVLHRVIKVRKDDYVILGDNCVQKEYGIKEDDIIGVMTGFVRNGKEHSTSEMGYKIYVFLILHTIPLRVFVKMVYAKLRSMRK